MPVRLNKLDLNLFIVFEALYREGGVTKVAVLLNITQPAVSNALSRLRKMFNDPLFVRTPNGMKPTPVADSMIADVRQALLLLSNSMAGAQQFEPRRSEKVFSIGMTDLSQVLVLPKLLGQLAHLAPGVSINSYYVERERATDELKAGTMDLLIDALLVNAKALEHQQLAAFPYVVAMGEGHNLAQQLVSQDDYLAARHVHVSSRRRGRGQVDSALHAIGQQRKVALKVDNYMVAAQVASQTDMLWTAPAALTHLFPLQTQALPIAVAPLPLHLFWSKSSTNDPANRWMRELLIGLFAELESGNAHFGDG